MLMRLSPVLKNHRAPHKKLMVHYLEMRLFFLCAVLTVAVTNGECCLSVRFRYCASEIAPNLSYRVQI